MKKIGILSSLAILSGTMLFSPDANAATLNPTSNSEVILGKVEYVKGVGEEDQITITDSRPANGTQENFAITIDPVNGKYETTTYGNFPSDETTEGRVNDTYPLEAEGGSIPPIGGSSTSHKASVKVLTEDPININCNYTKQTLSWKDYGTTIGFSSRSLSYWAGDPTAGLTHWYTSYAYFDGSPYLYNSSKNLRSTAVAAYYNWDFPSANKRTDVAHNITITANNNATYNYSLKMVRTGEHYNLLHFDIYTN
ncbi:hypothetical protein ACFVR2_17630 [Gottfriedia sp. NPDC057991]|uniref:hypothetical protein n=1 Tax=Gottfriedia sp. NPDC057991 TaxID=3346298 RepID=UPI0036DF4C4E